MVKKLICLMLTALMITSLFSGCTYDDKGGTEDKESTNNEANSGEVLTIAVDDAFDRNNLDSDLKNLVSMMYPEIQLEFVVIEPTGAERDTQLTNIRSEIMAGKGPDLFILPTQNMVETVPETKELFQDVEQAMYNRVFLPLDDYIAESKYINMEDHLKVVMDAGKAEGQQFVLPFMYSYNMYLLDKKETEGMKLEFDSFSDMVDNGDERLLAAIGDRYINWCNSMFADIADYEAIAPVFSQDELQQLIEKARTLALTEDKEDSLSLRIDGMDDYVNQFVMQELKEKSDSVVPFIVPNVKGGATGFVTVFTAINANTKHPDEAFKVLELLYSDEVQSGYGFRFEGDDRRYGANFVTLSSLAYGSVYGIVTGKAAYSDGYSYDRAQVDELASHITFVRFPSDMDRRIYDFSLRFKREEASVLTEELYKELELMILE